MNNVREVNYFLLDLIRSILGCTCGVVEMATGKLGIIRFANVTKQIVV